MVCTISSVSGDNGVDSRLRRGFDGILGIGPTDLTAGTTSGGGTIPTVTDNLVSQGTISSALVGASFVPTISLNDQNGELDFGAEDSSKFTGQITFVPITHTSPASTFWGIDQSVTCVSIRLFASTANVGVIFVSYGAGGATILATTAGIVDTGL